jgi:outer membrane protein assembly factor BamB
MNRKQRLFAAGFFALFVAATIAGCFSGSSEPAPEKKPENVVAGKIEPNAPWPMFGGTPSRNMANTIDKNIPTTWSVEEKTNIKWVAEVGSHSYGGPVVADGKVFVGTNNAKTKKEDKTWKAVLMAFDEANGKLLWKIAHEIPDHVFDDARDSGLCSTPAVEGKRLYYVTPGSEVVCAGTDGKVVWSLDMHKELKVEPHHLSNCSPLIVGDLVMVITGNGTDAAGKVTAPDAPSFLAVNKKTGTVAWKSNLPGNRIIEGQWSNPTLAVVNGKQQVLFAGGDCFIYSLEPETGKLIWKCNCNPIREKPGARVLDPYIISTPVVVGDRVYVGLGVYPTNGAAPRASYFLCLDISKTGDVSPKSLNTKDAANKDSALVWAVGGLIDPPPPQGRQAELGNCFATAAVHDGLVYVVEEVGYLHCFDAKTGKRYWEHDFKDSVWSSPYYVDGKIYVGTQGGNVVAFEHGKECKYYVDGKPLAASRENYKKLSNADLNVADHDVSTAVVANGVLYFATKTKLIAIANGK